jgi:hypothetical protein
MDFFCFNRRMIDDGNENSGQPDNDAGNAAATNIQADDNATSTETLSDIEKKSRCAVGQQRARRG